MRRLTRNQIILLVGAAILVVVAIVAGILIAQRLNRIEEPEPQPTDELPIIVEDVYHAPLNGRVIDAPFASNAPVIAVMIPQSTQYRTQSGLAEAEIVYEAIANGGVPRLMAFYQSSQPSLIGPVRSLRLHYIDWALPYQASIAYSGAAQYVLNAMRGQRDVGAGVDWSAYYREPQNGRPTEYTMYTSFERLAATNAKRGYTTSEFTAWPRDDAPTGGNEAATHLQLSVAGGVYSPIFDYDSESQTYARKWGDGRPHLDREKGQIAPSVVVAIRTKQSSPSSDVENITTTGSGDAYVFQRGEVIAARWSKASPTAPLTISKLDGGEILFARGQTWITAVPNNNRIEWE